MCGIYGIISSTPISSQIIFSSIETILHRGADGYGIYYLDTDATSIFNYRQDFIQHFTHKEKYHLGVFFHVLHAIEGRVIQPLRGSTNNSLLLFNGEIYNYKELNQKFGIQTQNDTQTLIHALDSLSDEELYNSFSQQINKLNGDYALVYKRGDYIYLARDYLGVKPLFYEMSTSGVFSFSSEKKALSSNSNEVLPHEIIIYNTQTNSVESVKREEQFQLNDELSESYEKIQEHTFQLLQRAVKKRLPSTNSKKIGLLFSGGVDSTIIALLLKRLGVEFTCYSAELISPQLEEAEDAQFSRSIANEYDLNLEFSTISIDELEELIIETMQIIETSDYIKVSVALPFLASCKLASTDSVDIMFSGLGSEEIFAGYRRHKQVENVNLECVKGLYSLHERDLYRDDVITMSQLQELRVPFLDKDLIAYCLQIPPQYKLDLKKIEEIKEDVYKHPYLNSLVRSKIILRDIGMNYLQLQEHFANRQKKAAQYGSKFDKGILRLAKNKGVSKQEYLNLLYKSLCDDNIS